MDGILTFDNSLFIEKDPYRFTNDALPRAKLFLNIPKPNSLKLDISRKTFKDENDHWITPVYNAYLQYIKEKKLKDVIPTDLQERWYFLGRLFSWYSLEFKDFEENIPKEIIPIPIIDRNGKLFFKEYRDLETSQYYSLSDPLCREIMKIFNEKIVNNEKSDLNLNNWSGEEVVLSNIFVEFDEGISKGVIQSFELSDMVLEKSHYISSVIFAAAPWEAKIPLILYGYLPYNGEKNCDRNLIIEKAAEHPDSLTPFERDQFLKISWKNCHLSHLPNLVNFPSPYEKYFAYGWDCLNYSNPMTHVLIQLTAAIIREPKKGLNIEEKGILNDSLLSAHFEEEFEFIDWKEIRTEISTFWKTCYDLKYISYDVDETLLPTKESFIPGAIGKNSLIYGREASKINPQKKFGHIIQKNSDL
jgi:hypothetical protein